VKTFKNILYFWAVMGMMLLLLGSCKRKPISSSSNLRITDSTVIQEKIRTEYVPVKGDSFPYEVRIECDKNTNKPKPLIFSKKQGQVKTNFNIDSSGTLRGVAGCEDLVVEVNVKDQIITKLRRELQENNTIKYVPYTGWFDYLLRYVCILLLIFIIILLIIIYK
jgi:hypothetical protein